MLQINSRELSVGVTTATNCVPCSERRLSFVADVLWSASQSITWVFLLIPRRDTPPLDVFTHYTVYAISYTALHRLFYLSSIAVFHSIIAMSHTTVRLSILSYAYTHATIIQIRGNVHTCYSCARSYHKL